MCSRPDRRIHKLGVGVVLLARILGRHFAAVLFTYLLPFPFSPPSFCDLFSETATDPFSCKTHGWTDSHSPPSPTISSVKKVMLTHCRTCYCFSAATPVVQSTHLQVHGWISQVSWYAVQKHLFLVMNIQLFEN